MRIVLRHTAVLVIEVLAGLLAVAILAGGLLAVRLKDQAPLQLSFLTPYLERALNDLDPDLQVKIGETLLTWSGWEHPLDLRARNVQVRDAQGNGLATLPDIALSLSVSALAQGEIAPAAIEVAGPRLIVVLTERTASAVTVASPKSRIFNRPSGVTRRLAGFRSRCSTPAACAAASP